MLDPATQIPRTSETAPPENSPCPALGPWLVFAVLFALFLGFPSRSYDGDALKRLGVLFNSFHLEGSNHPYTNAYFLGWWTLVKGLAPTDIIGRIDTLVAMNSLLGAGAAAKLSLNPFEAMTTITVKIVSQLTGDTEFASAETLVAFALGLSLFVITLCLNVFALYIVRKYREQYE